MSDWICCICEKDFNGQPARLSEITHLPMCERCGRRGKARRPRNTMVACTLDEQVPITAGAFNAAGSPCVFENFTVRVVKGRGTFEMRPDGSFVVIPPMSIDKRYRSAWTVYEVSADADLGDGLSTVIVGRLVLTATEPSR